MPPDFAATWFCVHTCVHWRRAEHHFSTAAELQDLSSWSLNIYLCKMKHVQQHVTNRKPFSRAASSQTTHCCWNQHLSLWPELLWESLWEMPSVWSPQEVTDLLGVTNKLIFHRSSKFLFIQMWKRDFLTCSNTKATKLFFQQAVEYKQQEVAAKLLLK